MPRAFGRRQAALLPLSLLGCSKARPDDDTPAVAQGGSLRIGYQKAGTLALLKWRGTLDTALRQRGISLTWAEFPSGPALLEALTGAQIDLGFVGEAPPIFAQAASDAMVYVATEPAAPQAEALLVRQDSSIRSVSELKGRAIALNKGSNVHYFLVKALERAGLRYDDVKVVFLPPADARAAFENGSVDAWAIWDPYLAAAQESLAPRVLTTAHGIAQNQQLYVARRELAEERPQLLQLVLSQLAETDAWVATHVPEAAARLSQQLGMSLSAVQRSLERTRFEVMPVTELVMDNQQRIADTFLTLGLVPRALDVRKALPTKVSSP